MRILHLIDGGRSGAARGRADEALVACGLAAGAPGHEHRVCLMGGAAAAARARDLGVRIDMSVRPPAGTAILARRAVRALSAAWRPDVVHAWDRAVAPLATAAGPSGGFVVMGLDQIKPPRWPAPDPYRTVAVVPVADADPAPSGAPPRIVAVPPPVRIAERDPAARAAVRRALRLAESDVAVLLLGDAPHGDAMRFVFLLRLLHEAGCVAGGLIPAAAAQVARAGRFQRGSPLPRLIVSSRPRSELLAAADVAVWEGGGPGPTACWEEAPGAASTPIAAAHAAGVPVVAPRWAMIPELYCRDSAGLCLAFNATLPELARRLLPMVEDASRRERASRLVRSRLRSQDPGAGFLEGLERAWSMAAGVRVVPARVDRVGALA